MSTVILTGGNHIITPNSPRNSNHEILRYKDKHHLHNSERILQKMWRPLEGVSLFTSLSTNYDGSLWIPGIYWRRHSNRDGNRVLPRFLTL